MKKEIDLDFIKFRRKSLKLSLKNMADALGFKDGSTYYRYEKGNYRFKADVLPTLSKVLKCNIEDFFK